MVIRGLQKLTLLDYPGKLAATVFLGGCNFRCPFCHNASLVLGTGGESISEDEFFSFLDKRRGVLEAVCVSGGEPTLHEELPTFIKKIRARGFLVKLDTNGYRPEVLSSLVRGARVTDSVSKSRIGTVDSLSFTPHMTETYSSTRDRMVEVPHPYFRDASVIVRAHGTEHRHGYRLGSFELFEGATVHFFTASFTGIGECTAIYESEASS